MSIPFPYERYEKLPTPLAVYYPPGNEIYARWVFQALENASTQLTQLLGQPQPPLQVLLVAPADWSLAPRDVDEPEDDIPHSYLTDITSPPSLVVPVNTDPDSPIISVEIDPIFGEPTQEKISFMLYHELALAFLEHDPRPWPEEAPLWADEWQFKFTALWLSQRLDGVQGVVNNDLYEQYPDIFEPEPDGKTPDTIRGFDWYDQETSPEDYLCYGLLLEQFAADLLATYGSTILPRFLSQYRAEHGTLLSEDITSMLATVLGPDGEQWLEERVYF